MYARYAHRTVSMPQLRNEGLDARGFLELIEGQARPA
jgi:hypothetical protein